MKKQTLVIILLAVLVVSCLALTACETTKGSEGLEYALSDDGESYIVVGIGTCVENDIVIPKRYDGKLVTSIGDNAFNNEHGDCYISSITIPTSVTSIGNYAFYSSGLLYNVRFTQGSKLVYIGDNAFARCPLGGITIPSGAVNIGNGAFSYSHLESITIPSTVKSIGDSVFSDCEKLEKIVFEEGSQLSSIGERAFYNCSSLTSITIPASVTSIGADSFATSKYIHSALEKVEITDVAAWCNIDFANPHANPLYVADQLYLNGSEVYSLVIPEGVTSICEYAFYGYDDLISVTIPASVTSIGNNAFALNIHSYNTTFGVKFVHFEEGSQLKSIGDHAFYGAGIESITIPSSVTSIGESAFDGCRNLSKVEISDIAAWCNIDFANRSANPLFYARHLYQNGEELTALVIPEGLTSILPYTFDNCDSLTSVTIPSGVTSIGERAFCFCQNLSSVTIPASVTGIGVSAFSSCALTNVTFEEGSRLSIIEEDAFYNCRRLESITIPASVTSIGQTAFAIHAPGDIPVGLRSIVFDNGSQLTGIGKWAFESCKWLERVEISDLTTWCKIKFANYYANPLCYARHLYINGEELTNLVVPEDVARLQPYAFINCDSIISVDIHSNYRYIPDYAFYGCTNLESVTFAELSKVSGIGSNAFYGCSSLVSITIPKGANHIDEGAFSGCESLTSVTFEDPDGWYIGEDRWDQDGSSIDLTSPSRNATYLRDTYVSNYLLADPWEKEWWNYPSAN